MNNYPCGACSEPCNDGFICWTCSRKLKTELLAITDLMTELDTTITRQDNIGTKQHGKSSETPLAFNTNASKAKTLLENALHVAARMLCEETETTPTQPANEWIAHNIASLRMREWAADAVRTFIGPTPENIPAQHKREYNRIGNAWAAIDIPEKRTFAGKCQCGQELWSKQDQTTARCKQCKQVTDVAEARDALLSDIEDRWLPASQVAAALSTGDRQVTTAMIRKYLHDGTVTSRAGDDGKATYRVGDVRFAITRASGRRKKK